ncbi:MAG: ABC transporter ATP-binding protein [Cyanobacteria bacterium SZAS LIN-5]|nr:ABC transporter ATP-binding protein [Cyanobacteria bacterium SZAS LIN-5]
MIDSSVVAGGKKASTSNAVDIRNVTKRFGNNLAADNINFSIEEGEFFSFLGPSGCGKTTLLRMIAGFERPTEGTISVCGVNMVAVPPHLRPVNMVFQNYALFPHLTIGENVAFGLKSKRKFSQSEIAQRVKDALELVRLSSLIDRLPGQLSGGQQQRIALARAVVNNPQVLLLDEPLSALDPQIREEMQIELARLQKRLGMTFVMVTHDQNEALALSSRIAVFCQGKLEQLATPEEIYRSPSSLFVAKFIGQTNVIEGEIAGHDANCHRIVAASGIEILSAIKGEKLPAGTKVAALIKPTAARFVGAAFLPEETGIIYDAQVLNKSFQGTSTEYFVSIQGLEVRVSEPNALAASSQPALDQSARIFIPADSCDVLSMQAEQ